jgi:hypothetical protein
MGDTTLLAARWRLHGLDGANRLRVQMDPLFDSERVYHDRQLPS